MARIANTDCPFFASKITTNCRRFLCICGTQTNTMAVRRCLVNCLLCRQFARHLQTAPSKGGPEWANEPMPMVDKGGHSSLDGIFAMLVSAPLRRFALPNESRSACVFAGQSRQFFCRAAKKYLFGFSVVLV